MANSIEITSNTLLKLLTRRGSDLDRLNTILSTGELGYSIDHKRLWIGDGVTLGGNIAGNLSLGNITVDENLGTVVIDSGDIGQSGDTGFDPVAGKFYRLDDETAQGDLTSWTNVSQLTAVDDISIEVDSNGELAVKEVSSLKINWDSAPEFGVTYNTGGDNFALSTEIPIDRIVTRDETHLELPRNIKFGAKQYNFPESGLGEAYVLHTTLNGDMYWDSVDPGNQSIVQNALMNAGAIIQHAGTIPSGWLVCNGDEVDRTLYADLYAVIGDTFGAGDGSTTFNLPNYVDKVPVGVVDLTTDTPTAIEDGGPGSDRSVKSRFIIKTENDNISEIGTGISVGSGIKIYDVVNDQLVDDIELVEDHEIRIDVGELGSPNTFVKESYNKNRSSGLHQWSWERQIDSSGLEVDFQAAVDATLAQTDTFVIPDNVYQIKVIATGGGGDSINGGAAGGTWIGYIDVEPGWEVTTTVENYADPEGVGISVDATWDRYRLQGGDTVVSVFDATSTLVTRVRAQGGQPGSSTPTSGAVNGISNPNVSGTGQGGVPVSEVVAGITSSFSVVGGSVASTQVLNNKMTALQGPSSYWGGCGAFGAGSYLELGANSQDVSMRGIGGVVVIEYQ